VLASEQDRPDVARKRMRWKRHQADLDPRRLVFVDETWAKTNMGPLRGWSPRGQRLRGQVPHGRWKTVTFLAALRHDRIDAPPRELPPQLPSCGADHRRCRWWVYDGPIDGNSFRVYVETVLVPTLAPGDVVILDNLGSHKGKTVRKAIRAAGAKLFFLPPYSPDLNPIIRSADDPIPQGPPPGGGGGEQVFAKLKHLRRKAQERTVNALWRSIGSLLDAFSPDECARYLANAGYAST
jgi:transposase